MRTLYYMNLESYDSRYTLQLTDWNTSVFNRRGINHVIVSGETLDNSQSIVTGQVLDAHGRAYYSMSQMMNLVKLMRQGKITSEDVIYFEDMFTPGFESLGYIINQVPKEFIPRIFVRCLAQTIDPDDFVHVCNMQKWMSDYEHMVNEIVSVSNGAILASNEEMVANMKIAGWSAPIYNISGLAFGKQEVLNRINNNVKSFPARTKRVAYAARWDQEKQPNFYMDLVEDWQHQFTLNKLGQAQIEFAIFSGSPLRSNDIESVNRAKALQEKGLLKIYENLGKNEYYELLNDTCVLFNCALQDWTSNTVSEADTLGCNVLFPAYRSFPEIFANDHERMYIPWSLDDVEKKLDQLIYMPHKNMGKISDWTDGTIDRILDIINGTGEEWNRNTVTYRSHVPRLKY